MMDLKIVMDKIPQVYLDLMEVTESQWTKQSL